ncbi:MAG: C40 family peptidase [Comamonadaceae bacterium]|nr:C40 family peptidase [Comamonadaceae bacterium]
MRFRLRVCLLAATMACAALHAHATPGAIDLSAVPLAPQEVADAAPASSPAPGVVTRLMNTAKGFLGVPYLRGGTSAHTGFDCSGFVRAAYEKATGVLLPRRSAEQAEATHKIDRKDLQPGDLVFFNTMRRAFSHVGIYLGDGKFIHSPRTGATVRIEDMNGKYWRLRFNGARRVQALHASAAPISGRALYDLTTH